jgi:hypothetical protein
MFDKDYRVFWIFVGLISSVVATCAIIVPPIYESIEAYASRRF